MRKYLGSITTFYAAIIVPFFVLCPIMFIPFLLATVDLGAAITLSLFCIICSLIWTLYIKQFSRELYSWGLFKTDLILIRTWFMPSFAFIYSKCRSCGIAYYTHSVLNSSLGTKHFFIFLSYDSFDERYRERINMFKTTQTQLKVKFRQDLFDHLVRVLPPKQVLYLKRDYEKYMKKTRDSLRKP